MKKQGKNGLLLVAVILTSCCLRAPITGIGSLIGVIQSDLGLNSTVAGLLSTIPLLMFAFCSPLAGKGERRFGAGRVMAVSMGIVFGGVLLRSYGGIWGLFCGTLVCGGGIAFGNVLLPSIIKDQFVGQEGKMTSFFSASMSLFAGISSGVSVPLMERWGLSWQQSLAVWAIPCVAAVVLWRAFFSLGLKGAGDVKKPGERRSLLGSGIAWWVTLFMGVQSLLFYCLVAWLPSILVFGGMEAETAGYYAFVFQLVALPASFALPILAERRKDQKALGAAIGLVFLLGAVLLMGKGNLVLLLGTALCGAASGASFGFSMSLLVLRTENSADAAALSGMSQSFGFALAAVGPFLMGRFYDMTGSWMWPLAALSAVCLLLTASGVFAGADRKV